MTAGLKSCPMCGETEGLTVGRTGAAGLTWWTVECHGCCVWQSGNATEAEAIAAWNTRATCNATLQVPDSAGNAGMRERVARIIAETEMAREGTPYSRTQEEFYSDAYEITDAILALPLDGRAEEARDFYAGQYARACGDGLRARSEAIEQCAIAARDAMVAMPWPPEDGDEQIDTVLAAIRKLSPGEGS